MADKKRILLVEDEEDMLEMVRMRLEASGYEVLTASDGQEALDKAHQENPDLIVLDIMLPKMDGYKVCGLLKADVRYNKIPVIMFSARAQDQDKVTAREVGADDYICKPFNPQELLEKISNLLKNK